MNRLLIVSEPGKDEVLGFISGLIRHIHAQHPEITVDYIYSSRRGSPQLPEIVREVEAKGGKTFDMHIDDSPSVLDVFVLLRIYFFALFRRPQLVHAQSMKAGFLVRMCRLLPGFPPVLYTPHAYYGMPCEGGKRERFYDIVESILGHIGTTHNCSEDERDFAQNVLGLKPRDLVLVHHGINTKKFSPPTPEEKKKLREELGIPAQGKLLVSVGRDSKQKNYKALYAALDEILPNAKWSFAHVGTGATELRETLGEPARRRAFAYEQLPDFSVLMRAGDGFIKTSRYEGLSLSMLQALSSGLEMILTVAPGLRLLKHLGFSRVRWLPDPGSVPSLVPIVESALSDWAETPFAYAKEQREIAEELFSEDIQVEKLVEIYKALEKK